MEIAAWIAAVLIAVLTVFHLALALGAPAGAAAWGGSHPGVLPTRLRIASGLVAIFFYPVVAIELLHAADVIDLSGDVGSVWIWVLAGLFTLGALANFASRSRIERIWGPISLVLAVCCVIIAVGM
ncbi:MAG TPA: hypothetical protein VFZ80_00845 [Acidimicrobiia bacterium]